MNEILNRYPRGRNFIRYALYEFPPAKVMEWFEDHGLALKTQPDLRVFPKSDKSDDVVAVFEKILGESNAEILFGTIACRTEYLNGRFHIHTSGKTIESDYLIITTGGNAGSAHNGYELARSLGHTITQLAPSLCALIVKENWVKDLSGVSFQSANLKLSAADEYKSSGPFVFSHKGVTGPAVFALSALSAYEDLSPGRPATLFIDLIPDLNEEKALNFISKQISDNNKKSFLNIISMVVPKSAAQIICSINGIADSKIGSETPKKEIIKAVHSIKSLPLTVIGRTAGDEFVTAGGVNISEIDPKTMESKIRQGLFFAGEVLDIDAFTGGFNLQAAWATGRLAGKFIAGK